MSVAEKRVEHVCDSCGRKRTQRVGAGPPCDECGGALCWGCCRTRTQERRAQEAAGR